MTAGRSAVYPTTLPLMRGFVDRITAMEGKDGVLSISIGHCFPYADVPELGGRILVDHRRRQGEGGPARDRRSARSSWPCAAAPRPTTSSRTRRSRPRSALNGAPDRHGRPGRQCRRRRAHRQHHHPAPDDRARGARTPRSARSGTRSRCGSASTPALGASFPLRFGGKTGPASGTPVDAHGDGHRADARLLAELRPDPGAARRLRRDHASAGSRWC